MYAQVNSEVKQYKLLDKIVDHKKDDSAIKQVWVRIHAESKWQHGS
jgi:hypothetical protein